MRVTLLLLIFSLRTAVFSQVNCTVIFSAPTTDVTVKNATVCNATDGSFKIRTNKLTGNPPYTFLVNGQPLSSDSLSNLSPGVYVLNAVDANGCIDSMNVSVMDASNITFINQTVSPAPIICNSTNGTIIAANPNPASAGPFAFSLNNGPQQSSNLFTGLASGSYLVTIFYGPGKTCKLEINNVYVKNIVTSGGGCNAGEDATIFEGESAFIGGFGEGNISWTPDEFMSDPFSASTYATPPIGINTFQMTAYNPATCTKCTDEVVITVIPELQIPNTFTPNGDNTNDVWEIGNLDRFDNCEIWIYTRWGERVFHQKGYEKGEEWNGTNHGLPLPAATYYYVIDIKKKDTESKPKRYAGAINIVK